MMRHYGKGRISTTGTVLEEYRNPVTPGDSSLNYVTMKKLIGFSLFLFLLAAAPDVQAQSKVKEAGKDVKKTTKKGAKKVGNKTAEVASKGKAKATDQVYKDKVGPNGETIYMDNHDRYYWVDKKGKRHYLPFADLRDKTN
jgi:hypothetical protein